MKPGQLGGAMLWVGIVAAILTMVAYGVSLTRPKSRKLLWAARLLYGLSAVSLLTAFASLATIVYNRQYQYLYAFEHTGNDLHTWYRFAATWSGQEGSFLLWGSWTAIIGFLVLAKAGRYEARVTPFFVSILAFLCAILIKQSPFGLVPPPTAADYAAFPGLHYPALDGQGLNPSLQNYWMTIHPPTIFFGFASLAVPFCYAVAALLWKDYDGWTPRVMPYALLSCATLGLGLFMGGYWAYETQGWHGFWGWDPVENASFFPWLAITALVHGLVVQKSRGGMGRTNTFLGLFAFSLFLLGTLLTRSGALASKGVDGQLLSVHAFDNISKSGLILMWAMLVFYGLGGLALWLARVWKVPQRPVMGDSLLSRDGAFFLAILLMVIACVVVTLGTTQPLFQSWMHRTPNAPKASFYNKTLLPLALIAALVLGCVPWLAWRKTNPDTFLRKLLVPWFLMIGFGFFMVVWVLSAERALQASQAALGPDFVATQETARAWINPMVQRLSVVALASLGFFAALSNAMLAYRVFRIKPLSAGGWLAHVGIGLLMIGVIVSNTYERTERMVLVEGGPPVEKFGYKFSYEGMTGKPWAARPLNPDYSKDNAVEIRVTPPGVDEKAPRAAGADLDGAPKTFVIKPSWFVYNMATARDESDLQHMYWPSINKSLGHDLYVTLANDAQYIWPPTQDPNQDTQGIVLQPKEKVQLGPYRVGYFDATMEPGKFMGVHLVIATPENKIVHALPAIRMDTGSMLSVNNTIPELRDENGQPGVVFLDRIDPATKAASLRISLPGFRGFWAIPLEVTYKPWINIVWLGVLIAVAGTLLAMVRRALEARKVTDAAGQGAAAAVAPREAWEQPEAEAPVAVGAATAPASAFATDGNDGNGKSGGGQKLAGKGKGKPSVRPGTTRSQG